jgi:hypothetical protein
MVGRAAHSGLRPGATMESNPNESVMIQDRHYEPPINEYRVHTPSMPSRKISKMKVDPAMFMKTLGDNYEMPASSRFLFEGKCPGFARFFEKGDPTRNDAKQNDERSLNVIENTRMSLAYARMFMKKKELTQ